MKRLTVAVAVLATAGAAAAMVPTGPHVARSECGNGLLALKAWSDGQRFQVATEPRLTNLVFIYDLAPPAVAPTTRVSLWQRRVWEIEAQIVEYRLDHGELRMVLYWDHTKYMNAVIPSPACLRPRTRQRDRITQVWQDFAANCGVATDEWKPLGAVVFIRGVGFWANKNLGRRGQAPNGAELHPVTGIDLVAGCGT